MTTFESGFGRDVQPSAWAAFAAGLHESATAPRRLYGIAGPPGVGKSTASARIASALRDLGVSTAVLPMDGFHLPQAVLRSRGIRDRMGAPDTFDVDGFIAVLRALRDESVTILAPDFERAIEEAVAGAIVIDPSVRVVLVEGNYLLLESDGWAPVSGLLDSTWYVDADEERRVARLLARHVQGGKTPQQAEDWVRDVDEPNARLIRATRARAQSVIRLD